MLLRLQVRGQTGPAQAAEEMMPSLLGGSWGHVVLFFRNFSAFLGCLHSCWGFSSIFSVFCSIFDGLGRVLGGF